MKLRKIVLPLLVMLALLPAAGCSPSEQIPEGLLIAGPGDLAYLTFLMNDWAADNPEVPAVNMYVTADSINDLKKGRCDGVLLGREPTAEELEGLKDYVIAYDAVCLIIDESSYMGGVKGNASYPTAKSSGLKNLRFDDIKALMASSFNWNGDYYVSKPGLDPTSALWTIEGGIYAWTETHPPLSSSFFFPPGKFDTQTVLYQKLGMDETALLSGRGSFTSPVYSIEEEVISYEYNNSNYTQKYAQSYAFKIGFASRRAMTMAPQHSPVKALSIDGIDPIKNTAAVADGTYPFSRTIHLLVREDASAEIDNLAKLLLSAGQQFIESAGYIPVQAG